MKKEKKYRLKSDENVNIVLSDKGLINLNEKNHRNVFECHRKEK